MMIKQSMPKAIFCDSDFFKEIAKLASLVETQQLHCQFIDVKLKVRRTFFGEYK